MPEAPDFSGYAGSYAASRPGYPAALFSWLASVAPRHELAWDTATGNGQAALGLAEHFARVVATDTSAEQIRHARPHPRVEYRVGSAESPGLPSGSVDLIATAAAIHWFDLPRFYEEAKRVASAGAIVAAWTYHVAHVEPPFDAVLGPFYRDVVASYFAAGARLVDARYETLGLPGAAIDAPPFTVTVRWTSEQILAFVRTWSGVQAYAAATGDDPVPPLAREIERVCGSPETTHLIRWPLYVKASRL